MDPLFTTRQSRRLDRQFGSISRQYPWTRRPLAAVRNPRLALIRIPLALVLIAGGFLAILPFFGLWMIPLGLLLLAVDIPTLRGPVASLIVRARRRFALWRRRWRG